MTDTKLDTITIIYNQRTSIVRRTLPWIYLVGSEGISHWWFGGSWVIDLLVLVGLIVILHNMFQESAGAKVNMTVAEIQRWAAHGCPLDIAMWRKSEKTSIGAAR